MAITTALFGPTNSLPDYDKGEWQWLRLVGDGTQVLVAAGAGILARVVIGAAGTRATFHDVASGGAVDGTTMIVNLPTNTLTVPPYDIMAKFTQGLTVVTTGAANDITILFSGRAFTSTRQFGVA